MVAVLAGCGADDQQTGWRGSIDTLPNGTIVVRSVGGGAWGSQGPWRIVEDLRLGTPAEGPQSFTNVVALEVDRWGRIYVLDREAQEIRVFDSTGSFVRTIGRRGRGPGEFALANGLAWNATGQLWVVDQRNEMFMLFDTTGRLLDTRPRRLGFSGWRWEGAADGTGRLFENQFGQGGKTTQMLLRFDSRSQRVDTFPLGWVDMPVIRVTLSNGGYGGGPVPFPPKLVWRIAPDGYVWLAATDRYRVVQRALGGDSVRIVERAIPTIAITRGEIDSAVASFVAALAGPAGNAEMSSKVEGAPFPRTKPAIRSFVVDDVGRLWVLPYVAAGEPPDVFDVFARDGRFMGRLSLPFPVAPYYPVLIRGDRLYAVTQDADAVPYVVRARITPSRRAVNWPNGGRPRCR